MNWSLAKAKDNFSEVIRRARTDGPQEISVHGQEAAVVISAETWRQLTRPDAPRDFKEWLLAIPQGSLEDAQRRDGGHRPVDL